MMEDEGELHTINFLKNCYNLRQDEMEEPAISHKQWVCLFGDEIARQVGDWLGCTWSRAQAHADVRGQEDRREEYVEIAGRH